MDIHPDRHFLFFGIFSVAALVFAVAINTIYNIGGNGSIVVKNSNERELSTLDQFCVLTNSLLQNDTLALSADDQFQVSTFLHFCKHSNINNNKNKNDKIKGTELYIDNAERILLFASSLSFKPAALMSVAEKHAEDLSDTYSTFGSPFCHFSSKYIAPAANVLAEIDAKYTRALTLKLPQTDSGLHYGINFEESALAAHLTDITAGDETLQLAGGQRFLLGGDRFPQSFSTARSLFAQSALSGSADALTLYAMMLFEGLGGPKDELMGIRLLFLCAKGFKIKLANLLFNDALVSFIISGSLGSYSNEALKEAREVFDAMSVELSDLSFAGFNLASLDLATGGVLMARVFLILASSVAKHSSPSSLLIANLMNLGSIGPRICTQAASLHTRVARKALWSHALAAGSNGKDSVVLSPYLRDRKKNSFSDFELSLFRTLQLAYAGVDDAHWLAAQFYREEPKHSKSENSDIGKYMLSRKERITQLVKSAESGRRQAQVALGNELKKNGMPFDLRDIKEEVKISDSKIQDKEFIKNEDVDEQNSLLDDDEIMIRDWFPNYDKKRNKIKIENKRDGVRIESNGQLYSNDKITAASYLLAAFRSPRWTADEGARDDRAAVEASLMLSLMSLTRRGFSNGLKDSMKWILRIRMIVEDMSPIQTVALKTVQLAYLATQLRIGSGELMRLMIGSALSVLAFRFFIWGSFFAPSSNSRDEPPRQPEWHPVNPNIEL